MRILKRHSLLKPITNYVIDAPTPSNLNYWWNVGSLLGLSLGIQIITGVTLAMHYNPSVLEAFNSVEHIMRDVNNGWLIRYLHANAASAFFFLVYLHVGKGLYYGSYKSPRTLVWVIGTVMLILMMAIAFLGYVLPYGQMSLWGATVITNLLSAIPWIGQDIVEFVWGGFSVNNATLNRFFSLHFVLPFALSGLVLLHLVSLHDTAGSGNPLGISANPDRVPFSPYYTFKDLITVFIFMLVLSLIVFFVPNVLGDSENYVMANPMQTPPAIVPEWYLLPYYAILRSIPNKLFGVIAMFSAILAILTMTFVDTNKLRGMQFKPFSKLVIFLFVTNLLLLLVLGAKHVESPFIEIGQLVTFTYFIYFAITMPFSALFESTLSEISENIKNISTNFVPRNYMLLHSTNPILNIIQYIINYLRNPPKPHSYVNLPIQSMPTPGVKCPCCGEKGKTVWVMPGKTCPNCGTVCGKSILISTTTVLMCVTLGSLLAINFSDYFTLQGMLTTELCDVPRPWDSYFQGGDDPQMELIIESNNDDHFFTYLITILFITSGTLWLTYRIHKSRRNNFPKYYIRIYKNKWLISIITAVLICFTIRMLFNFLAKPLFM